jgi:hypothetical protein
MQDGGDIEYWLQEVNHIFAQALVGTSGRSVDYRSPVMNPVRQLSIRENLGPIVNYHQKNGTIFDVLKNYKESSSDVNIFWVWGYQSTTGDFGLGADPMHRTIVIQDNLHRPERQLAIAFARLFGVTRQEVFADNSLRLRLPEIQTVNNAAGKMRTP